MLSVEDNWTVCKRRLLQFQPLEPIVDSKHNRPLKARGHKLTEEDPSKVLVPEEKVLLD